MTTSAPATPRPALSSPRPARRVARSGVILCLVSAVGFGLAPIVAKECYAAAISVSSMLSVRFALAATFFWAMVAWRRPNRPSARVIVACVALGGIGYALQANLYFAALTSIDASLAALLLYVYPALVTVLAITLRRERPERRRFASLACAGLGLVLLLGVGVGSGVRGAHPLGVMLALGAAAAYAIYLTVAESMSSELDLFLMSALVCSSAFVSMTLAGLWAHSLHGPAAPEGWWWVGLLAVISTMIPVVTMFAGVRKVGAPTAAVLSCVEPIVTVSVAALVLGEHVTLAQVLGGAAVLAAVLFTP